MMENNFEESIVTKKLKELIREQTDFPEELEFDKDDFSLDQIDFDSIKFVELIVMLEDEFHIEFKDEDLIFEKIISFYELDKLLNQYVNSTKI